MAGQRVRVRVRVRGRQGCKGRKEGRRGREDASGGAVHGVSDGVRPAGATAQGRPAGVGCRRRKRGGGEKGENLTQDDFKKMLMLDGGKGGGEKV